MAERPENCMSYSEHYSGTKWIKVKKFTPDRDGCQDLKAHFKELEDHHQKETEFLIAEIRKLAKKLDEKADSYQAGFEAGKIYISEKF